jgi:chorismate--pyruvate lyase
LLIFFLAYGYIGQNGVLVPFIDFAGLPWKPKQYLAQQIPEPWRDWVLDSGSLTQRLKQAFHNDFTVELIRQGMFMPTHPEQKFLSHCSKMASIREVLLICEGKPRVFARSVIPHSSLIGSNRELLHLGNKSLGDFLFTHPGMRRGPLEVAVLPARQFNHHLEQTYTDEKAWGRRSLFYLHDKPISVCEVFLPELTDSSEALHFQSISRTLVPESL